MQTPLNFGPSEQSPEQRKQIADRALAIVLEEGKEATPGLLSIYEKYVAGKVDLYAISIYVEEQTRKKLLTLVDPNDLT